MPIRSGVSILALLLLALMFLLAGGAALRESVTIDEVAHIGAGVSYLQKLDLRYNEEHPPLAKVLAALPLVVRGTRADYSGIIWSASQDFFPAYLGEWVFGRNCLGSAIISVRSRTTILASGTSPRSCRLLNSLRK